jgi:hypothetical protein
MDMVNNVEPLYNDKNALYDKWVEEGDTWSETTARQEALAFAANFAEAIESMEGFDEKYKESDLSEAADAMLKEFEDYREEAVKAVVERTTRVPRPEDLVMDPGDIEHAKKYDDLAKKIGIEFLRELIPASPEKVQKALASGDKYLNSIPLRKWDAAAMSIQERGLSLSEKVCALKHVATWHYA